MPQIAYNSDAAKRDESQPPVPEPLATSCEPVLSPAPSKRHGGAATQVASRRKRNYWADPALHESISCPRGKPLGYLTEARLIERAQQGDVAARNIVWYSHLRLAMTAINEFHIPRPLVPDAFQEAAIGLEQAIMRYEVRRFLSFSTYAWYWIAQRVRRLLASQRSPIRIPDYLHRFFANFCHERKACRGPGEWFDWFDSWSSSEPDVFLSFVRIFHFTHDPPREADLLAHTAHEVGHRPLDADEKRLIHGAVLALSERERNILERRFGLDGKAEATLEAIARELGLTRERVRQIQQEAFDRLRSGFARFASDGNHSPKANSWGSQRMRTTCQET